MRGVRGQWDESLALFGVPDHRVLLPWYTLRILTSKDSNPNFKSESSNSEIIRFFVIFASLCQQKEVVELGEAEWPMQSLLILK
jgi:hypothetical protein